MSKPGGMAAGCRSRLRSSNRLPKHLPFPRHLPLQQSVFKTHDSSWFAQLLGDFEGAEDGEAVGPELGKTEASAEGASEILGEGAKLGIALAVVVGFELGIALAVVVGGEEGTTGEGLGAALEDAGGTGQYSCTITWI